MNSTEPRYGHDEFGNPITEEYVAEAVLEAEAGYDLSPHVSFPVTDELRERAELEATRRGTTVSQLAREALERYLAS